MTDRNLAWPRNHMCQTPGLSNAQLEELLKVFETRAQAVNDYYLRLLGEHMKRLETLPPSDIHRLTELKRMNANIAAVQRRIARMCDINERDVEKVLKATAEACYRFQAKYYNGVTQIPFSQNKAIQNILTAQYRQTKGAMHNLSNTTVVTDAYKKSIDRGIQAVQSGVEDYGAAIRRTIREAGSMGLLVRESGTRAVTYQSGHTRRVDTAVRQNILDGVRQMNHDILMQTGEEFGANGVEIDAHMLCAEDHLPYQGQQYTMADFEQIQDGLMRPFGEWNCRHMWSPIIIGISPRGYTDEQISEYRRYSTEQIEIDGRTKTRYQWSQEQRRIETAIRQQKDTAILAKAAGDDALRRECQSKIGDLQERYKAVSAASKLSTEWTRVNVTGFEDVKGKGTDERMARNTAAVGQWPAAGEPITQAEYHDLSEYAKSYGITLHGFEKFDGDVSLVRDFLDAMNEVASDYPTLKRFTKKGLHLNCNYRMDPNDYAMTQNLTISINAAAYRSREALQADYEDALKKNLFVHGTTYRDIPHHEMGHLLVHAFKIPRAKVIEDVEASTISLYAETNAGEAIAEAFSAFYAGVNNESALTIKTRCDNIISERGG